MKSCKIHIQSDKISSCDICALHCTDDASGSPCLCFQAALPNL